MDMNVSLNRSLTNSQIYDGEYFEVVRNENDILVVRCNICTPDGTDAQLLRTSIKSNGNILKHIKRRHLDLLEKIKETKSVKSRAPRLMKRDLDETKIMRKNVQKVQVKILKNDEDMEDPDRQVYILNEDQDPFNAGTEIFVSEQCDSAESDGEEYVEYELNSKADDQSLESIDENGSMLTPEYDYVQKPQAKRARESIAYDGSPSYKRQSSDRSLLEFQKKLMQMEFDDIKKLRHEKHQLEIAILKAELTNKTLEHQKQMELLNKKLQE